MSFTPKTWNTGDRVNASDMNRIEQGIADGGGGAVIITDNGTALDKTYAEIYDLVNSGTPCYIKYNAEGSTTDLDNDYAYSVRLLPVVAVHKYNNAYRVFALDTTPAYISNTTDLATAGVWVYQASTSTGYPTFMRRTMTENQYATSYANRY